MPDSATHTVFVGHRRLASGALPALLPIIHAHLAGDGPMPLLFDNASGAVVDLDLRGGVAAALARLAPPRGRGRPSLGVAAREVTLLPRQWEWLAAQPGGASVALRRLVDAARRDPAAEARATRDAIYRCMAALAGDLPGFETASCALFAGDDAGFATAIAAWPDDVRDHLMARTQP
jgi:hypothetical protein